jgi:hypothetical protein
VQVDVDSDGWGLYHYLYGMALCIFHCLPAVAEVRPWMNSSWWLPSNAQEQDGSLRGVRSVIGWGCVLTYQCKPMHSVINVPGELSTICCPFVRGNVNTACSK